MDEAQFLAAPGSDLDLATKASAGDATAARVLVQRYSEFVWNCCARQARKMNIHSSVVEDLVQITWMKAWRRLGSFRGQARDSNAEVKLSNWLYPIILGTSAEEAERGGQAKFVPLESAEQIKAGAEHRVVKSQVRFDRSGGGEEDIAHRLDLQTALDVLPPKEREAIELVYFVDLSIKQAAETLGIPYTTCYSRINKALRSLAPALGVEYGEEWNSEGGEGLVPEMLNHARVVESVLSGEFDADVVAHLDGCSDCSLIAAAHLRLTDLSQAEALPAPADLVQSIMAGFDTAVRQHDPARITHEYVREAVLTDQIDANVLAHLDDCTECSLVAGAHLRLRERSQDEALPLPPDLVQQIMAGFQDERRHSHGPPRSVRVQDSSVEVSAIERSRHDHDNVQRRKAVDVRPGSVLLEGLTFGYTETPILNQIELGLQPGNFVFFTGRSGTGKTTLMKVLLGLVHPQSGEAYVDGIALGGLRRWQRAKFRRRMGCVFQDYKLLPDMTAFQNVLLPLRLGHPEVNDPGGYALDALELLGLKHKLDELPGNLSKGEQQLIAVARAIAHQPRILLADDPTNNLDRDARAMLLELFAELNDLGCTVIIATEDEFVLSMFPTQASWLQPELLLLEVKDKGPGVAATGRLEEKGWRPAWGMLNASEAG